MNATNRLLCALLIPVGPFTIQAQGRVIGQPDVEHNELWASGGAQVMQRPRNPRRPVASQFDSLGIRPLGAVGDSVTLYYFGDGANLTSHRHAQITRRERFLPPNSWRAACDAVAHPGWLFRLNAPSTSAFAVVVSGTREMPVKHPPHPFIKGAAKQAFMAWADSSWQRWRVHMAPVSERREITRWYQFYGDSLDAGWNRARLVGLKGPDGKPLAVFSHWLNDDHADSTPNTAATWLVNSWGGVVARSPGHVDIYGTTDHDGDGIEEVITSRGVIHFDGTAWRFPAVYSEEPCLMHRVMEPPPGRSP